MNADVPRSVEGKRIELLVEKLDVSEARLLSVLDLPDAVGLADVYAGGHELSASDLVAVADVLDVPVTVLTGELPLDRHLGVSLRMGAVTASDVPERALQQAEMMLSHMALLDSWMGRIANPLARLPVSQDGYFLRAGKTTAARVRDALGLGGEPIPDIAGLIESLGIPVSFQPLPVDVHGLNVRDEREGLPLRVIIVSAAGPWTKQRFTLAHELCHALYDDADQVIVDRVEVPDVLPELRAESFARHLLAPSESLVREVSAGRQRGDSWSVVVANLIVRWGISRTATVKALVDDSLATKADLATVSAARVSDLIYEAGLTSRWQELNEDDQVLGSPMLVERAVSAFGNGWVSVRVVAELLGLSVDETTARLTEQGWITDAE